MQSITILQGILHSRRYQTHEQAVKTCSVHTCAHTRVLMVCVYAPVYVMHAYVYPLKNAAGKTKNEKRKTKNEKRKTKNPVRVRAGGRDPTIDRVEPLRVGDRDRVQVRVQL